MICISNANGESDRNFGIHIPYLIIARPNDLNEEEDNMALNKGNKSLRELMAAKGKESTSKATLSPKLLPLLHISPLTSA